MNRNQCFFALTALSAIGIATASLAAAPERKIDAPLAPTETAAGRFAASEQTVVDNKLHLVWSRCEVGMRGQGSLAGMLCIGYPQRFAYDEAGKFITYLNDKTHAGWRLPTRQELASLFSNDGTQLMDPDTFYFLETKQCYIWSSTQRPAPAGSSDTYHYMVGFRFDLPSDHDHPVSDHGNHYGCLMLVRKP